MHDGERAEGARGAKLVVRPRNGIHDGAYDADDDARHECAAKRCNDKPDIEKTVSEPGCKVENERVDYDVEDAQS